MWYIYGFMMMPPQLHYQARKYDIPVTGLVSVMDNPVYCLLRLWRLWRQQRWDKPELEFT